MADIVDISDIELHAYVDGALDAARRAQVEERIRQNPALAARVAAYRRHKELVKDVFAPVSARPLPPQWLALAHSTPAPRTISRKWIGSIAAALAIGVLGVAAYQSLEHRAPKGIVEAALDARSALGGTAEGLDVPPQTEANRYDRVLSDVVKLPVRVPSMQRMGFQLVGLRLYRQAAAAELLYRDRDNRLFTLYLRQSDGTPRFDQFERDGLRVCVWQNDEVGAVMAGNVSTAAMQRLAVLAYTGLKL